MLLNEILYAIAFGILGVVVSITDMKEGRVYNKTLLVFTAIAVMLGIVYYGYFARDLIALFSLNIVLLAVICLTLFYTHSFAGGDCKLTIVMGLLYPANYYLMYGQNKLTIVFALGFAIFYGYLYLLATSIEELLKGRKKLTKEYIKNYLRSFIKSFVSAAVYISGVNLTMIILSINGIAINIWLIRLICIVIAWIVGKSSFLKKKSAVVSVVVVDIVLGFVIKTIPFSINPENYILVVILLLCQMTIRTNIYEDVLIENLKSGMILSSLSSMLMQNSRIRGLPKLSTEDLSSRLTENEVNSIKRWANSKKIDTLTVVRKIPFAIFIFLGFVSYFILWSVVK